MLFRSSLADATLPLLTIKHTFLRGIVNELLWLVRGWAGTKQLSAKGVKIWDGNGSKTFLEKRGLGHPVRATSGPSTASSGATAYEEYDVDYVGKGVDQLRSASARSCTIPPTAVSS